MNFKKEIKVGLIAIGAILGFVFLYQFMKGKNIFSTDNTFYAKYENVEGLERSSPVSINGLKVGQVDKITPVTDPKTGKLYFLVEFMVQDRFSFSKKSTVEVFEPGLMSGKQLRINMAYGEPLAQDGDTLASGYKLSMLNELSSQVGPVKDQLQGVLKTVDSLANNANRVFDERNRAQLAALLQNLNATVQSFEVTSKQANALVANNDPRVQKMLDNANLATISAKTTIEKVGNQIDKVDVQNLNNAIDKLSVTADKLNGVVSGIQNGEGSLGKLTKDEALYNNLTATTENLNKLIEDMKANPKRYVNFSVFGKNNKD